MGLQKDERAVKQSIDRILDSFAHFGVKLGLESTLALLDHLDNPHRQVSVLHVAGTNGKGSVCAYLANILGAAGYRVGRYTSPHLLDWTERICINHQCIPASSLLEIIQHIQSIIHRYRLDATQFEVITVAAWLYFAQQQVDVAVIEVGLGGRLDTTNVCDRPLASIITSIGRDHWQQLGNTPGEIATEKAGILKSHCPAIIGPVPPAAQTAILHRSQALHCPTQWVSSSIPLGDGRFQYCPPSKDPPQTVFPPLSSALERSDAASDLASGIDPWSIAPVRSSPQEASADAFTYSIQLKGVHQGINSALAIATIHTLQQQGWTITTEHLRQGLAATEWPGRLQWITWNGQQILLDGAHNTAAAIVLLQYVETLPQPIHWIIGMLDTKDHRGVLNVLLQPGDRLSLVPVPNSNTAAPEQLATVAQSCCASLAECDVDGDVVRVLNQLTHSGPDALTHQLDRPKHCKEQGETGTLVMCGSLYLIGYVLNQLNA